MVLTKEKAKVNKLVDDIAKVRVERVRVCACQGECVNVCLWCWPGQGPSDAWDAHDPTAPCWLANETEHQNPEITWLIFCLRFFF